MRVSLSRWTIVSTLVLGLSICSASGCRTGGAAGWGGWSTPSWMSWNNWGWGNNTTAVAQAKPSTTVPKPSSIANPQPTTSVAAGTGAPAGYPTATNPNYAANSYPAVSRGYSSPYSTQPAAAYQPAGATGQVQPTVGYQTGPYGMTSAPAQASAPTYGGNGNPQANYQAAGGQSWNAPANPQGGSTYQTADHSNQAGYAAAGAYNQPAASPAPGSYAPSNSAYGNSAASGYSQGSQGSYGQGPAPAATGAWQGYSQPAAPYQGSSVQPAASPAAAVAGTAHPTTVPANAAYPSVPAALATDANSYRPGSTAGNYGVQNAGYAQAPPSGGAYNAGGAVNYGNTYTR